MRTTASHLARAIGADERTLRRAIERGAVRCTRATPRRVDVSDEEERYLRERWPLLQRLAAALRTEVNVRLAAVFGSAARGDEHSASDVDLLVVLGDESWQRRHALNTRLERAIGARVDLVVLDRAARGNPALLADALRDARVIVDRDGRWPTVSRQRRSLQQAARAVEARATREAMAALDDLTTT